MQRFLLAVFFILTVTGSAFAALQFPALTGRVVDDAGILSAATQENLTQTLKDYEQQSGNQIVVVTLRSLQGTSIEDFGYQLGRFWGIGQKGKDNGVLLIVAPNDHKVRIEVGYGLESVLTDAMSSNIIQTIILPAFRAKDMERGILNGTDAIISVVSGKAYHANNQTNTSSDFTFTTNSHPSPFELFFPLLLLLFLFIRAFSAPFYGAWGGTGGHYYGGLSSGGSFGGGGFSGGGGSFGGGGASGGW